MKIILTLLIITVSHFVAHTLYGSVSDPIGRLIPREGHQRDDFAYAVAISDKMAVVGARYFDAVDIDTNTGAAFLFDLTSGGQTALLLPHDKAPSDFFGFSVGIDRDSVVVGSYGDDDLGLDSGSAYLFDPLSGSEIHKLLPSDGNAGDEFGKSVAVDGASVLVGSHRDDDNGPASGSAYLFDAISGSQLVKLLPDDGTQGDEFGTAVAISGNKALVGASRDDDNGQDSGSAYLFDTTTGAQFDKLLPMDGAAGDGFGYSLNISENLAIVGAPYDNDKGENSGSAYVFDLSTGQQLAKLTAIDGEPGDEFGNAVDIDGGLAIVGAYGDDVFGELSGSGYLFDLASGAQICKFVPEDEFRFNQFGFSVGISGRTAIVGSPRHHNLNALPDGTAYLYSTIPEPTALYLANLAATNLLLRKRRTGRRKS